MLLRGLPVNHAGIHRFRERKGSLLVGGEVTLVQRYARTPEEIERRSLDLVQAALPDLPLLTSEERYVLWRIVRAEGDPTIASSIRFSPGAVEEGLSTLKKGAPILTDVRMVEVGVSRTLLAKCRTSTRCAIATAPVADRAQREGTTRSVAAMREMQPYMQGAVVAVGNAPTALLALLDLVDAREVSPALVIGMPVGFVACAEAKEELIKRSVPYIAVLGMRGGSSAAAATVNALLDLATKGESH